MRATHIALLIPLIAASACERPEGDAPATVEANLAAPEAAPGNAAEPASIMRPSVVNEITPIDPEVPEPMEATISFAGGGARLSEAARAEIARLLADPAFATLDGEIVLRGHSDSQGDDEANLRASRARAEAVRNHLVEQGVVADRIRTIALGEQRPVAANADRDGNPSEEGRAKNRRVEIEVLPAPPAPPPPEDVPFS